jgi:hypothetical protein
MVFKIKKMKSRSSTFILFAILILNCQSQAQSLSCNWLHTFGSPGMQTSEGSDITTDGDGNFIVAGNFGGTMDVAPSDSILLLESEITSAFLAKYSPDQELIWAFVIGGPSHALINKVRVLNDGRILLSGNYTSTCDFDPSANEFLLESLGWSDAFMAVYSNDGSFINAISVGGSQGDERSFDSNVDNQGNFYFTGYFSAAADLDPTANEYIVYEYTGVSLDMFIVKLSPALEFIWGGIVSGPGFEIPTGITINENNEMVIVGLVEANPDFNLANEIQYANLQIEELSYQNCFIAKYALNGSFIDAQIFGGVGDDYITTLTANDSGYLIAGTYSGIGDFDPGSGSLDLETFGDFDAFLIQLDFDLNAVWSYNIGSEEPDYFYDIALDAQGNIALAGTFEMTIDFDNGSAEHLLSVPETVEGQFPDAIVVLLSPVGQFKEAQNFGGWRYDRAYGVAISGNKILLTGYFTLNASLGFCSAEVVGEDYAEEAFVLCLDSEYLNIETQETISFSIYPNPADQVINIAFSKLESLDDAEIRLNDMQGRLIKQTQMMHNHAMYMLDCSALENGTYLLSIESEKFVRTKKIVITH